MKGNLYAVIIKFPFSTDREKTYSYTAYEKYEKDDYVVVNTTYGELAIAQVCAVVPTNLDYGREVICKVDFTEFNKRKEKKKRKEELREKMQLKIKELEDFELFELLAQKDSGMAELLREFKEL